MKYFLPDNTYTLGFKFKQKYPNKQPWIGLGLAGKPHLGLDLICNNIQGVATLDGRAEYKWGSASGHAMHFYPKGRNHLIRFMHMTSKASIKTGEIKKGDKTFITGNSGASSTPHEHVDIWNLDNGPLDVNNINGFLDPATYDWQQATPLPMTTTQRLLILHSHVDNLAPVQQGSQSWIDFLKQKPELADFNLDITYAPTDVIFRTTKHQDPAYGEVIYADPLQIIPEGKRVMDETGKKFDVVVLIYDGNYVIGEKPNHPVQNPVYQHGFTVWSMPVQWYNNLPDVFMEYFGHENTGHAGYFLINTRMPNFLFDKTHNWFNGQNPNNYPNNNYYIRDYLLELKPYWSFLGQQGQQGAPMLEIVNDNNTYFIVGNKGKLGINGPEALAFWRTLTDKERTGSTAGIPSRGTWEKAFTVDTD